MHTIIGCWCHAQKMKWRDINNKTLFGVHSWTASKSKMEAGFHFICKQKVKDINWLIVQSGKKIKLTKMPNMNQFVKGYIYHSNNTKENIYMVIWYNWIVSSQFVSVFLKILFGYAKWTKNYIFIYSIVTMEV